MIINHNISSLDSSRILSGRNEDVNAGMQRVSSGLRINKAGDDASGLAVSEKMRTQVRGLTKATENAQNGISFIQTTEGFLQQTQDILGRVRELAVQAANGIYGSDDRGMAQNEVNQLVAEIDRIASHAQFNGMNMLTGRFAAASGEGKGGAAAMYFHIGANADQRIQVNIGTINSKALKVNALSISSAESANSALNTLDSALSRVSKQRADLGAYQNRLTSTVKSLQVAHENLAASESVIRDANIASEMVDLTKSQILQQANMAMLVQANNKNQGVLRLLG